MNRDIALFMFFGGLLKELSNKIINLPPSGIREFFELTIGRDDIISLGIGEPDFSTPWHIRDVAIKSLERGRTMYTSNRGILPLRNEIAKYVEKTVSHKYVPENEIVVTVGGSEALDIVCRGILNPGDEVIYHSPCFVAYDSIIMMAGGTPVAISTHAKDDFNLLASDVEKAVTPKTKAILLNFPCNPTGASGDENEMKKIAMLIKKHDLYAIVDDIYNEVVYEKVYNISRDIDKDNLIYINGFSKSYAMTGIRIGYVCSNKEISELINKIHQYTIMCASITAQDAAIEALRNGDHDKELMRKEYEKRRNYIVSSLNEMGLKCFMPKGAFYVYPSVQSTGLEGKEFAKRLLKDQNVAVVPGDAFGKEGKYHVRCCYAVVMNNLQEAMTRIKTFVGNI